MWEEIIANGIWRKVNLGTVTAEWLHRLNTTTRTYYEEYTDPPYFNINLPRS